MIQYLGRSEYEYSITDDDRMWHCPSFSYRSCSGRCKCGVGSNARVTFSLIGHRTSIVSWNHFLSWEPTDHHWPTAHQADGRRPSSNQTSNLTEKHLSSQEDKDLIPGYYPLYEIKSWWDIVFSETSLYYFLYISDHLILFELLDIIDFLTINKTFCNIVILYMTFFILQNTLFQDFISNQFRCLSSLSWVDKVVCNTKF